VGDFMRTSVIRYLGVFSILVLIVMGLMALDVTGHTVRHHQHLNRPSEADLGMCQRCSQDVFLCTHLPIISIDTFGQTIPGRPVLFVTGETMQIEMLRIFETTPDGETEIPVYISVVDNHNDWSHSCDEPQLSSMATMRIRGNSSRWFDKPNYRIRLTDTDNPERSNPLPLLGMPASREWSLHGPFLDKTLLRNYMWMNIASEVMAGQYVPNVRFFELILDGEYQGVYVLMETLTVEPNRLSLSRYRYGMNATSYFVRIDPTEVPERQINIFSDYTLRLESNHRMEILYPRRYFQGDRVRNYVTGSINAFERLLHSREMVWSPGMYQQYIDVDSFVNYFIINEFISNNDVFSASTYFHKDVRGRLVAGPVWDFNNIFDNFFLSLPHDEFILSGRGWFDRLFICEDFTEQVIRRWNTLRRSTLSEERLNNYMDDVVLWLGSAVDRNFDVWGYSFDPTQVSIMARRAARVEERAAGITIFDVNPSSFEDAIEQKRNEMNRRGRWIDANIETLRQYSHHSRHALWIVP